MSRTWAAVIVNYEAGPLLAACAQSVLADSSGGEVELVVVDNGSGDGSVDLLREVVPDVRVVAAPGNVGYARAANLGIAATRAPVVAVFNPDLVVEPGTAKPMLSRFDDDPALGACGPRIRNVDGSDYPSARRSPSVPLAIAHGLFGLWWPRNPFTTRYRELDADPAEPRLVDWVSGAAVWLRRSALDAVGGWDEDYFMYMEDIDLCRRLGHAGFEVAYEPAGVVTHVQGASTSRTPYRMLVQHHRSAWQFARKRLTGARSVLLPFAAVYLTCRCVMAMAEHAFRASGARHRRG
ncbi:MAG TPA: glycosyltransferase family 2 protein [Acidimicrobiia bacterium]|nr:glycosyltransferase family 2 protein [Acidimicrobiia bacterium]